MPCTRNAVIFGGVADFMPAFWSDRRFRWTGTGRLGPRSRGRRRRRLASILMTPSTVVLKHWFLPMAQPIGLVEQFLFSHWRGRSSIISENIVTDFGSKSAIYEKTLEGRSSFGSGGAVFGWES